MNRPIILAEWRRAGQSLRAAQLLRERGLHADAVSRAYYAVLHAGKAALLTRGIEAERHAAVRRLFGLHLVRTGEFEPEWAAHLGETSDDWLAADYDVETSFSTGDAVEQYRKARKFLERVRCYPHSTGFSEAELREDRSDA